jgi:hypothetical protein
MYIFLDESGDLGFDFTKSGTSKFFIITVLVNNDVSAVKAINLAACKTLKRINHGKKKNFNSELKGTETPLEMKRYFLSKINNDNWNLYTTVIDKRIFHKPKYIKHPNHLYNYISSHIFNRIPVKPNSDIIIRADKCKTGEEIRDFNRRTEEILYPKLNNSSNVVIKHLCSHDDKLLQAVDLFCNGLFAKYEHQDLSWYSYFQNKICVEDIL